MDITLALLLTTIFNKELILEQARQFGAMTRLREIHPADFMQSLIVSAMGDEERTIATARRTYGNEIGFNETALFLCCYIFISYTRTNRGTKM